MASGPDLYHTSHDMSLTNGYGHEHESALSATSHAIPGDHTPATTSTDPLQTTHIFNGAATQPHNLDDAVDDDVDLDDDEDAAGEADDDYDDIVQHNSVAQNGRRHSISSESSDKSLKRKRNAADDDDFMLQNPELYGLRRSGRARGTQHMTESLDEEEDDDVVRAGRKRQKNGKSTSRRSVASSEHNSPADSESDDDVYGGSRARTKKARRKPAATSGSGTPLTGEVRFSNRRTAKKNTYNEEELDDEFEESEDDEHPGYYYVQEEIGPAIDVVLNHRLKEDAPTDSEDKRDFEYQIKWQEKAYIHATWEDWKTLSGYKGFRRLENYFRKVVTEDIYFRLDPEVSPEDRERWALDRETKLDEIEQHSKVERVINRQLGRQGYEYYVKWQGLYYEACTWESAATVSELAQDAIDNYLDRDSRLPQCNKKEQNLATRSAWIPLRSQPDYVKFGTLREFQLTGMNFLMHNWCKGNNVILADEMGLGKTVQTVGFINWLHHDRGQEGPFIVVVPLSTLPAWADTFNNWAPDINYVIYSGNEASRKIIREEEMFVNGNIRKTKFNVLLTTYEFVNTDATLLSQVKWQFMAVDEAHRLKNSASQLYANLLAFGAASRLLITGTPLQNTLGELSALMEFLMPGEVHVDANLDLTDEDAAFKIKELTEAIHPYMLRRTKQKVESDLPPKTEKIIRIELADTQLELYKNILARNYTALNAGNSNHKMSLLNVVMELKKCSNHAFMFPHIEEKILPKEINHSKEEVLKAIVQNSGKMIVLDRLLTKLKKEGHRVLIFSQMVGMLNILSDYLHLRGHHFQRLDGTIPSGARKIAIDHFNAPESQDFAFLLSTRAGGLGINLMTADTVILFDSDWNPQADLQAMARAHRIGQKKPVSIYRFVGRESIEEEVLERARNKLMLEYLTIHRGITDKDGTKQLQDRFAKAGARVAEPSAPDDISLILRKSGEKMFKQTGNSKKLEELDIDHVLATADEINTEQPEGMTNDGGEEFLRSFEYTDVKLDASWDDIIPQAELQKIKAEEAELANQEYLKSVIEANAPRKRKAPADDERDERAAKKRARAEVLEAADDDSDDDAGGDPARPLNEKECRNLVKAFERYGSIDEMEKEVVREARLVGRDVHVVKSTLQRIRDRADALLEDEKQRQKQIEIEQNRPATKKEKRTVLFDFNGVKRLNAETLKERPEDLSMIRADVATASNWSSYRLLDASKAATYSCPWGAREDGMLLVGIARHGYGAWATIRDDHELGLHDKFYLEEHRVGNKTARVGAEAEDKNAKSPGAVHLVRRTAYLISVLRNKTSGGSDEAAKRAFENHHRNNRKGATRNLTPGGSASPMTRPMKNGDKRAEAKNGSREKMSTTNGVTKPSSAPKIAKRRPEEKRDTPAQRSTPVPATDEVAWDRKAAAALLSEVDLYLRAVSRADKKHMPDQVERLRTLKTGILNIGSRIEKVAKTQTDVNLDDLWRHVTYFHWPGGKKQDLNTLGDKLKDMYQSVLQKGIDPPAKAATPAAEKKPRSGTPQEKSRHVELKREGSTAHSHTTEPGERKPATGDRLAGLSFQKAKPGDRTSDSRYNDDRRRDRDDRREQRRSPPRRERSRSPRRDAYHDDRRRDDRRESGRDNYRPGSRPNDYPYNDRPESRGSDNHRHHNDYRRDDRHYERDSYRPSNDDRRGGRYRSNSSGSDKSFQRDEPRRGSGRDSWRPSH